MVMAYTTFWKKRSGCPSMDEPFSAEVREVGKFTYAVRTEGKDEKSSQNPAHLFERRDYSKLYAYLTVPTESIEKLGSQTTLGQTAFAMEPEGMPRKNYPGARKNFC